MKVFPIERMALRRPVKGLPQHGIAEDPGTALDTVRDWLR